MKNITIVTSGHPPLDERIFYKFGRSLKKHDYNVTIVCSNLEIITEKNGIVISGFDGNNLPKTEKINLLTEYISGTTPDVIICCEPLTILSAYRYKRNAHKRPKIISDVTEWYPENVALKFKGMRRVVSYISLFLFNIYTANHADALIIGEPAKKRRYDIIAPLKKKTIIGYYPVLEFFNNIPYTRNHDVITLGYAGVLSFERGILTLLETAVLLARRYPERKFRLKIAGRFQYEEEEVLFRKKVTEQNLLKIEFCEWVEYPLISSVIADMDICFDLRKRSFIYRNSLPIKIFEYMACAKPVIYSDIKPVRQLMQNTKFGFLTDPRDKEQILIKIENYLNDPSLLNAHSSAALKLSREVYNWEKLEPDLLRFIKDL